MPSLTVFVTTHSEDILQNIPRADHLKPILLGELDIPDRFKGESLSENRLFLSKVAEEVDTEYVGIVSSRLEERDPHAPKLQGLANLLGGFSSKTFWAPRYRVIGTENQIRYWVASQNGVHPGMGKILDNIRRKNYGSIINPRGAVFNGNQFIVHRDAWLEFIASWRLAFRAIELEYGLLPPFQYRCWNCHKLHTNGFGRYTTARHLGFIGERLTALHFAHNGLVPSSNREHQIPEPASVSSFTPDALLPIAGKVAPYVWSLLKVSERGNCAICL